MISGANDEELDIANIRADFLLEIQDLQQELQRKDNIINEMKKASDEIFHKYPYERKKWSDKIKELEESK